MKKLLLIIFIFICVGVYWVFKGFVQQRFIDTHNLNQENLEGVDVIAHRGASGHAPENTLAAFQLALEFEADLIELDVHMSKDGEAIVFHDATLDRTSNGTGLLENFTVQELKALDAGSWFSEEFKGEGIPILREVLDLVAGESILLIEIKRGEGKVYEGLGKKVVDVIRQNNAQDWCIVQAFDSHYIKEINGYDPEITTQKLIVYDVDWFPFYVDYENQTGWVTSDIEVNAVNSYYKFLTSGKVKSLHKDGYETHVYTINQVEDMKKMIQLGVDGIITDFPDVLISLKKTGE